MALLRLLSLIMIVLSLMLLGADVVSTLERSGQTVIRSFDQIVRLAGFDMIAWFQQTLPPQIASALTQGAESPGWAVLGIPGTILGLLTPRRRDKRPAYEPPPISR